MKCLLSGHHPIRQLRSSSAHLFSKPAATSKFTSQAFSVSAPTVWNSLKPDLRSEPDSASNSQIVCNPRLYKLCIVLYCSSKISKVKSIQRLKQDRKTNATEYTATAAHVGGNYTTAP